MPVVTIESTHTVPITVSEKTVWRHLVLRGDDGSTGVGEYTISGAGNDLDADATSMAERLIGRSIDTPADAALAAKPARSFRVWTIVSAMDQALEDLRARRDGVSLARHLDPGAERGPMHLYANINRRTSPRTPEAFAAGAKEALAAGYTAVKLAPFDGLTPALCGTDEGEALIEAGLDRIRAVGAVTGGAADLMVDCHWRFTTERAVALLNTLAGIGVVWFECPIPETYTAISDLRALRSRCADLGMRLAGAEKMNGLARFQSFIDGESYDVIMPDVKHAGGLTEIIRIAAAANERGIACSLHNPSGPVAHLVSVHIAAALAAQGNTERLEIQFDESPLFGQMTAPAPQLENGTAFVPDAPGLGCRLREV